MLLTKNVMRILTLCELLGNSLKDFEEWADGSIGGITKLSFIKVCSKRG